jgi:hypothetical protein
LKKKKKEGRRKVELPRASSLSIGLFFSLDSCGVDCSSDGIPEVQYEKGGERRENKRREIAQEEDDGNLSFLSSFCVSDPLSLVHSVNV